MLIYGLHAGACFLSRAGSRGYARPSLTFVHINTLCEISLGF